MTCRPVCFPSLFALDRAQIDAYLISPEVLLLRLPHVVPPHGGEHQEVRDEHEGNGEEDDFGEA